MGRSQRNKGKRGEIRARDLLREVYPDAYRSANQAGSGACCDVEGTPWFVEAKEEKKHQIWAAVRQAVEARDKAGDDRPIVVISHRTRGMTLAVVPWSDWRAEMPSPLHVAERWLGRVNWEKEADQPTLICHTKSSTEVVVMCATDFIRLLEGKP